MEMTRRGSEGVFESTLSEAVVMLADSGLRRSSGAACNPASMYLPMHSHQLSQGGFQKHHECLKERIWFNIVHVQSALEQCCRAPSLLPPSSPSSSPRRSRGAPPHVVAVTVAIGSSSPSLYSRHLLSVAVAARLRRCSRQLLAVPRAVCSSLCLPWLSAVSRCCRRQPYPETHRLAP